MIDDTQLAKRRAGAAAIFGLLPESQQLHTRVTLRQDSHRPTLAGTDPAMLDSRRPADDNGGMKKKAAQKPPRTMSGTQPADDPYFAMDMLGADGEPAEPTPEVIRVLNRAIDQVREGAARVVVKGTTGHQCQVQLVPLFIEKATARGLEVKKAELGRLRVGKGEVFFEPLYFVRQEKAAASKAKRPAR